MASFFSFCACAFFWFSSSLFPWIPETTAAPPPISYPAIAIPINQPMLSLRDRVFDDDGTDAEWERFLCYNYDPIVIQDLGVELC